MRLTDLIGCRVTAQSGQHLGHVVDVRAARRKGSARDRADQRWRIVGLLTGSRALIERLGVQKSGSRHPTRPADLIPWEAVVRVRNGEVVVNEGKIKG
jgi:sporulation protein YlmC with PRC-barrel domain